MKRKARLLYVIGVLFSSYAQNVYAGEMMFIQPFKAKVYSKPAMTSEVLGQVDSGYQFESAGKEGSWVKLLYKGKNGYLPAVQAAKAPPLGKSSVQAAAEMSPKLGARARTSSSSAVVAGMKGLTYEDRARVTKGERSDYESLDKIEQLKISAKELTQFQLEGGKR